MMQQKLQTTKSRHAQGTCSEDLIDRFKYLSDEVCHHILSFLTFRELTRVSTVSKRFRELCLSVPSVTFEASRFARNRELQVRLMSSFERYLLHRSDNTMQRFFMSWNFFTSETSRKHSDEHFRIVTWIRYAMRCNVEELDLNFAAHRTAMFAFPSCVFRSESLRSLRVCCHGMNLQTPSLSFSFNLRFLRLTFVNIVDESLFEWISRACKCIKEIQLVDVTGIKCISIESSSLESFKLSSGHDIELFHLRISGQKLEEIELNWKFDIRPDVCSLNIFASNLKRLKWEGKLLNIQNLGNLMCLGKAEILLQPEVNDFDSLYKVLCSVCRAPVLILNEAIIKVLFREGSMPLPGPLNEICNFRMHLTSFSDALVPALVSLFRGMPNLNTLNIKCKPARWDHNPKSFNFDMGYWEMQNLAFVYQLQEVSIELCDGSNEVEFARYILEHAQNLKKMVIQCSGDHHTPNDVLGKVCKCKMFSTTTVVIKDAVNLRRKLI